MQFYQLYHAHFTCRNYRWGWTSKCSELVINSCIFIPCKTGLWAVQIPGKPPTQMALCVCVWILQRILD